MVEIIVIVLLTLEPIKITEQKYTLSLFTLNEEEAALMESLV